MGMERTDRGELQRAYQQTIDALVTAAGQRDKMAENGFDKLWFSLADSREVHIETVESGANVLALIEDCPPAEPRLKPV